MTRDAYGSPFILRHPGSPAPEVVAERIGAGAERTDSVELFWQHVSKSEGDGCWLWTGAVRNGYGLFSRRLSGKLVTRAVHRFSYELRFGPIPDGLYVCHRCDTKRCVRPEHLFLGTAEDNTADMIAKGRAVNVLADRNSAKTHCPKGHEYTLENTKVDSKGRRNCRACVVERSGR